MVGANNALAETPLAIAEVVAPHIDKLIVKAHAAHSVKLPQETFVPRTQGVGVVSGDVAEMGHLHIGHACQRIADHGERGQASAGENVALNKKLMQDDGIHPNEMAQPILLQNIWDTLLPLIQ